MFNEQWFRKKESDKELALGWLYNNQIGNDFANGYTKNLLDYWSIECSIYGFETQFADNTPHALCKQVHEAGYSKILVLKQGTTLGADFFENFTTFYDKNKDAKLVGHILDKGDKYYRLHPQAFMFDLNWWADAGFPEWGDWTKETFTTVKPQRSLDNWHDSYTPKWIAKDKASVFAEYKGGEDGWNIIKALIEDNQKIISWNEEIRNNKFYGYPEVSFDGPRHLQEILTQTIEDGNGMFFIGNTETIAGTRFFIERRKSIFNSTKFDHIITPAAGLTPLIYAFNLGIKPGGMISIFDVSKFAIGITKRILKNWKGEDYINFAKNLMDDYVKEGEEQKDFFKGVNKLSHLQDTIDNLKEQGFQEWLDTVLPTLDIRFHYCNMLDPMSHRKLASLVRNSRTTYIHLSNIFHYLPSAFYFSLEQRWNLHNELVGKLVDQVNNKSTKCKHILLQSSRGVTSKDIKDNLGNMNFVEDWNTVSFNDLDHKVGKLFKWQK